MSRFQKSFFCVTRKSNCFQNCAPWEWCREIVLWKRIQSVSKRIQKHCHAMAFREFRVGLLLTFGRKACFFVKTENNLALKRGVIFTGIYKHFLRVIVQFFAWKAIWKTLNIPIFSSIFVISILSSFLASRVASAIFVWVFVISCALIGRRKI